MAKKKSVLKSGGNNALGVGSAYQWQPGTTFRQVAEYLANDPHSGLARGQRKKVGWGKFEWVRDMDDYNPTERVMEYLRRQPAAVQKHYGVYDMLSSEHPAERPRHTGPIIAGEDRMRNPPATRRSASQSRSSGSRRAPSRGNYDGMSFNQAFAAASRAGLSQFNWRGRPYSP